MRTRSYLPLAALLASLFLTGCVTGTRQIDLAVPDQPDSANQGQTIYIADISDSRVFDNNSSSPSTPSVKGNLEKTPPEKLATLIGRQRNGFGKAMGDVALVEGETVSTVMYGLLKEGLESRGHTVVDDESAPLRLDADIAQFWAWFTPGMWVVSFESQVEADLKLSGARDETIAVSGYGVNKGQVASDANWKLAYQRGLEDFLKNLDKALADAGL